MLYMPPHTSGIDALYTHRWPLGGRCDTGQLGGGLDIAPVVLPAVIFVGDDLSVRIRGDACLANVRRAIGVPAMFVPAHELQAHRRAGQLRQQRCRLCSVVVAAVAVGSRPFRVLHAQRFRRHAQQCADAAPGGVDILRGADHQAAVGAYVSQRAVGCEGRMRLIGSEPPLRDCDGGFIRSHSRVAALQHHVVDGCRAAHLARAAPPCRAGTRDSPIQPPGPGQRALRPIRGRDHADEVALAQHPRAGNIGKRAFVDADHSGAGSIGALAARAHDASVHHAGHAQVLDVVVAGTDLASKVGARWTLAHQAILAAWLSGAPCR